MKDELQTYFDNTKLPWGRLFYRMVLDQLGYPKGLRILDFGSGFGITADALAADNEVIAVEPYRRMTEMAPKQHPFTQLIGKLEALEEFPDESFDLILCHNVLEYAPERDEIIDSFARLLKKDGVLSVVRHNHPGRVMQKVVFEQALDEAKSLLGGGAICVRNFGEVHYYPPKALERQGLSIKEIQGIRIFWALQPYDESKKEKAWQDRIFEIEQLVCREEPYKSIAMFQHVFLTLEAVR
ncbi:MAG: methyltransferase domain-containing protein [Oscillospiraceae bacterium]|jgi:S-adenosylmethionine-dependent methyltransferase|nr:methyltransferase domain-containing protein [Oscillospiraceae bacterium]